MKTVKFFIVFGLGLLSALFLLFNERANAESYSRSLSFSVGVSGTTIPTVTGHIWQSAPVTVINSTECLYTSQISWETQNMSSVKVTVREPNTAVENVFALHPNGNGPTPWLRAGKNYRFTLWDTSSGQSRFVADTWIGLEGIQCSPMSRQTTFRFSNLSSGAFRQSNGYGYKDFAIVINYFGTGTANINVKLSDPTGFNYVYTKDNLEVPLIINGNSVKKTVLLNVAGVAFPVNNSQYEYHPNITVDISADKPVYVLPPEQFSASGFGSTVAEATEKAWQAVSLNLPPITDTDKKIKYFPYAIFWRNLSVFPDGWDTKITITNSQNRKIGTRMNYFPDYNKIYDRRTCTSTDINGVIRENLVFDPGETQIIYLRDYLDSGLDKSHQTEGSLGFEFTDDSPNDLKIKVEVVPLEGGTRICMQPTELTSTPVPTPTSSPIPTCQWWEFWCQSTLAPTSTPTSAPSSESIPTPAPACQWWEFWCQSTLAPTSTPTSAPSSESIPTPAPACQWWEFWCQSVPTSTPTPKVAPTPTPSCLIPFLCQAPTPPLRINILGTILKFLDKQSK